MANQCPVRQLVFLSHANPEDNEFARWLSTQLAQQGYRVWSDITKLLGGEDFWRDIEVAIREGTAKFLYALSRISNTKQGPLNELAVARQTARKEKLPDFIVPLLIDDLPHGDINIEMARLNAISFHPSWASGLEILLKKLAEDGVPFAAEGARSMVADWWRRNYSAREGLKEAPEEYLSNWFPVMSLPSRTYFHELSRQGPGPTLPERGLSLPTEPHGGYLVSFAPAPALGAVLPDPHRIARTLELPLEEFLADGRVANLELRERRNYFISLLRQAWEGLIRERQLGSYELADRRQCVFTRHTPGKSVRTEFRTDNNSRSRRALTGFKTVPVLPLGSRKKRFWHFALSVRPLAYPVIAFAAYPHVIFSDDGVTPWESKPRMHRARRSQCKDWWNDDWRDRLLAMFALLSDGGESLALPTGAEEQLEVAIRPLRFLSPVSYAPAAETASIYGDADAEDLDDHVEEEEGPEDVEPAV